MEIVQKFLICDRLEIVWKWIIVKEIVRKFFLEILIFHSFSNKKLDQLHNFCRLWKRHNLSSDHSAVNLSGKTSVYGPHNL